MATGSSVYASDFDGIYYPHGNRSYWVSKHSVLSMSSPKQAILTDRTDVGQTSILPPDKMFKQMYIEPCNLQSLNSSNITNQTLRGLNYSVYKIIDDSATLSQFANEEHPLHEEARKKLKQYEEAKGACFANDLELASIRNKGDESEVIKVLNSKGVKKAWLGAVVKDNHWFWLSNEEKIQRICPKPCPRICTLVSHQFHVIISIR